MGLRKITALSHLVGIIVLSLLLVSNYTFGKANDELSKEEKFLTNLLKGMESNNEGLKESCIYMIGAYKLEGASQMLIEQAKTSNDDKVLQLIAWSLYEIGNEDHCKEFQNVADNLNSEKVTEIISYLKEIKRLEKSVVIN